jgi:DNA polymerase III epsilon subunit-like protein
VALDVETTGLDPLKDRLLEVGLAVPSGIVVQAAVQEPTWTGEGEAAGVNGISAALARSGAPKEAALVLVRAVLARPGVPAVVVGHNVGFDLAFLVGSGAGWAAELPAVDTAACARLLWPGERARLEDVCARLGVDAGGHRAGPDALAEARCWEAMVVLLAGRGIRTWGDLLQASAPLSARYERPPWPEYVRSVARVRAAG